MSMNLAIVHYHLNRGGVTRVIENQLAALDAALEPARPWRAALVYGGRRHGFAANLPARLGTVRLTLHELPALDYDDQHADRSHGPAEPLADKLAGLLGRIGFAPQDSVVHVHNHTLGKNVSLPSCLARLAGDGYPLLLQIHDFAEDFRPANYRRLCQAGLPHADGLPDGKAAAGLYPQAPHVHYAVLNGRDYEILLAAGIPDQRLHRLPNPVPELDGLPARQDARVRLAERFGVAGRQQFVLYPVRCIRRKNVGEALLYAALAPPDTVVGLTLPPINPSEVPIYENWKRLAAELDLPCCFEVGGPDGLSFAENLAAADLILTTSLAEGFGMVFLESWLTGRPLVGRDLPEITRDFTDWGLRFDHVRPRLSVPVEWITEEAFRRTMLEAYRRTLLAYGREEPADLFEQLDDRIEAGMVDFGDLDEARQQQVLRAVCGSAENRRRLLEENAWIEAALSTRQDEVAEVIQENAQVVRRHLSQGPSGRKLLDLYRQMAAGRRDQIPQPLCGAGRILDELLAFRRFRPIRS